MEKISPARRLRVNDDTFVLPDLDGRVYFRNNVSSFRMEGRSIEQWVERLLPLFNGELRLGELTEGLPDAHQQRVYEIASVLYNNGFARDVNEDAPHGLSDAIVERFAAQIAFLDNVKGSGASLFEGYRHARVLLAGTYRTLVPLTAAAVESGLSEITLHLTDSRLADLTLTDDKGDSRNQLQKLLEKVTARDSEAKVSFLQSEADVRQATKNVKQTSISNEMSWDKTVRNFDAVLLMSESTSKSELERLERLERACRENRIVFLPAILAGADGFAGPQTNHDTSAGSWRAMWKRIHKTGDLPHETLRGTIDVIEELVKGETDDRKAEDSKASPVAVAVLANVAVFELFKSLTQVTDMNEAEYRFYRLNLNTLQGDWHSYIPHPADSDHIEPKLVSDFTVPFRNPKPDVDMAQLLHYFEQLTDSTAGIFHLWDEGDLTQLPLSLCRVQPISALSQGPAELFPEKSCAGLTHEDARREAGLTGLEDYIASACDSWAQNEFIGIGAGANAAEAISRALHKSLTNRLRERTLDRKRQKQTEIIPVQIAEIEDEVCDFYLQVLHTLQAEPKLGLGEDLFGLPVVWLVLGDKAMGTVGMDITSAFRTGLQHVLLTHVIGTGLLASTTDRIAKALDWEWSVAGKQDLVLTSAHSVPTNEQLQESMSDFASRGVQLQLFDAAIEPFLQAGLPAVYGIVLREEEVQ